MSQTQQPVLELWFLRLYLAENAPQHAWIERNIRTVCDQCLPGAYHLEVIEVTEFREQATGDGVSAVPCLVRRAPLPTRTILADFSNLDSIRRALALRPGAHHQPS